MKKIFLIAVVSVMSTALFAQMRVKFGGQLGFNAGTMKQTISIPGQPSQSSTGTSKFGFVAGLLLDLGFTKSISFRPEINFIQKGTTVRFNNGLAIQTQVITTNYIEIPFNFEYKVKAGPGKVFFGLGPNFGFGISGTVKNSAPGYVSTSNNIKFDNNGNPAAGDPNAHLQTIDFGGNINAGYELNMGVFLNVGYTFGFIDTDPSAGSKLTNSGFALKVGYMIGFGGKSKKSK